MMSECIPREAAYQELDRFLGYLDEDMIYGIKLGLASIPAVGVIPTVQCKDCKFAHFGPNWITCQNLNGLCTASLRLEDSCSRGERRSADI